MDGILVVCGNCGLHMIIMSGNPLRTVYCRECWNTCVCEASMHRHYHGVFNGRAALKCVETECNRFASIIDGGLGYAS